MDIPGIPSIPTDNLYKFVALSGILLLLAGFAVPAFTDYRQGDIDRGVIAELNVRNARRLTVVAKLTRATAIRKRGGPQRSADAIVDSANAVLDSLDVTEPLVKARMEARTDQRDFFEFFAYVGIVFAVVGGALAIWGFINWYIKLQKPLDEIMKREAQDIRDHADSVK